MQLIIHRGTREIGGTVIELRTNRTSLLVDIGQPLNKNSATVDVSTLKPDAALISHPHQDHYGLIDQLEPSVPVYMGALSKQLISATRIFLNQKLPDHNINHFEKWRPFTIGDMTITPYLMDHSATDAYAFLIEAEGKRIFYSGDFRASGNKAFLFDRLLQDPPRNVDLLLLEGTMMRRRSDQFPDEASVRRKIEAVLKDQENIAFLVASSQNIDRLVSAIHACELTEKILVIDIYTAWVLELVSQISTRVATMEHDQVNVYADHNMDQCLKNNPGIFGNFRKRLYRQRVTKEKLNADPAGYLCYSKMSRFRTMDFYKRYGPINLIYSQWLGYLNLKNDTYFGAEQVAAFQADPQVNFTYAHTTGHATVETLAQLERCLQPGLTVPVHTEYPQDYSMHFSRVTRLKDGEPFELM